MSNFQVNTLEDPDNSRYSSAIEDEENDEILSDGRNR